MLDFIEADGIRDAKEVYIFDGAAGELLPKMQDALNERFGITNVPVATVGPVIGVHAGPGLVGILIIK